MNKYLAEIGGIHAGDGYLRYNKKYNELDISGSLEEKEYYDKHISFLFQKAFNLKIKTRYFPSRNTYGFTTTNRNVIKNLQNLGFPSGKKSTIVKIPDEILKNKFLVRYFLRGYFDTDGCLTFGKKYGTCSKFKKTRHCYPRLIFTTVSKPLAKDLEKIFERLSFNALKYEYKPKILTENLKIKFFINGANNLKLWLKLIGIGNPTKYSRYLIWKKYGFCPPNTNQQCIVALEGLLAKD